jgi:cathepsin A (carboxypeptidase C)
MLTGWNQIFQVSMDNYVALLDFFSKFPEFKSNPFFVTGESYGGVYVPTLSYRILQGNSTINMKVGFQGVILLPGVS